MQYNKEYEDGFNGFGLNIVEAEDRKELDFAKQKILELSKKQTPEEIRANNLLSLKFQMQSYVAKRDNTEIIEAGFFLQELIRAVGVSQKVFAKYIDYKPSNLSALLKGRRKISIDLALKLGKIFNINPTLWINIQSKNELRKMQMQDMKKYEAYHLDTLLSMQT